MRRSRTSIGLPGHAHLESCESITEDLERGRLSILKKAEEGRQAQDLAAHKRREKTLGKMRAEVGAGMRLQNAAHI